MPAIGRKEPTPPTRTDFTNVLFSFAIMFRVTLPQTVNCSVGESICAYKHKQYTSKHISTNPSNFIPLIPAVFLYLNWERPDWETDQQCHRNRSGHISQFVHITVGMNAFMGVQIRSKLDCSFSRLGLVLLLALKEWRNHGFGYNIIQIRVI